MTVTVTDPSPLDPPQQTEPTIPDASSIRDGGPRDAELLRRFVRLRDDAAFAELVRRHSTLVMGVCRRVLRSEHDIEDAFQATFLVLARDAGRIRRSQSLASWLHGVAYRTSLRALDSARRRGRLLRNVTMHIEPTDDTPPDGALARLEERHQQQALDEELAALPDTYRGPLVLHYLDGKSNQEVADELGLTVTAVEGRLKRGKKELRLRLARRGIGLSVAVAAMHAVQSVAQASSFDTLIARTIDAGLSFAGGEAAGPVYTPEAARLAGQELAAMSTTTAVTLATIVALPLTLGLIGHGTAPGPDVAGAGVAPTAVTTVVAQVSSAAVDEAESPRSSEIVSDVTEVQLDGLFTVITVGESADATMTNADRQEFLKRVLAALESPATFEFNRTPLTEAMGKLQEEYGIPITIDLTALEAGLVSPETRVSGRAGGEKLEDALKKLLEPHNLEAKRITNGLMVTIPGVERMRERLQKRLQNLDAREAKTNMLRFDEQSPLTVRIENELAAETEIEFVDTPLSDAVRYISELHNIRILIDEAALTDIGVPTDQPINLIMSGVQLRSALDLMLRQYGLTTIVRDEVLMVTTSEVADQVLETVVYDVGHLGIGNVEQLVQVIESSIPDARWKSTDEIQDATPAGTITAIDGALVVMQTQAVHEKIANLLAQLQRYRSQVADSKTSMTGNGAPVPWERFAGSRLEEVLNANDSALVYFHTDWARPCQTFERDALYSPAMTDFLKENNVEAISVNCEQPDALPFVRRFGVTSVPTTVVFAKGKHEKPIILVGSRSLAALIRDVESGLGVDASER